MAAKDIATKDIATEDIAAKDRPIADDIKERIKKWVEESKTLKLLFTGKTGVGKSSLANALVGDQVSPEGESLKPQTTEVSSFECVISGVTVTIWDSPGLQDGTKNEEQYLKKMAEHCKELDLVLYCTRMDDSRIREEDYEAIRKLTLAFGEEVWRNAVFALTFANTVKPAVRGRNRNPPDPKQFFHERATEWRDNLREAVQRVNVSKEIVQCIPVVPVGYQTDLTLPDREDWLSSFWLTCMGRMSENAKPALLKINADRLRAGMKGQSGDSLATPIALPNPASMTDELAINDAEEYALVSAVGFLVGSALGLPAGPAGVAVGAAVGLTIAQGTWLKAAGIFDDLEIRND